MPYSPLLHLPHPTLVFLLDISLATGTEIHSPSAFIVNVNGTIVGLTRTPSRFVANFRKLRDALDEIGAINAELLRRREEIG